MTTRRGFLQVASGTALVSLSGLAPRVLHAAAQQTGQRDGENILVVVQLSGGNDGLNTVVPYGDPEYYRNRFTLAIGREQVLRLDDYHGLHPSLRGWEQLWQAGQLAIVQGVGYANPNRSHFESMDLWHTAHLNPERVRRGWLGRYLDQLPIEAVLPAVHYGGEEQPLALAAERKLAVSLRSLDAIRLETLPGLSPADSRQLVTARRDGRHQLLDFVQENAQLAILTGERLRQIAARTAQRTGYPGSRLAQKLQVVASLIAADLPTRVYYVSLDGFDTHANQEGAHAALLAELGDAVAAFQADLREQGNDQRVTLMTFSEFGRRVRENASRGTDHGTAAPMFFVGGRVRGGLLNGHPSLTDLQDGDLKHSIDYRQAYATVLERWLHVDAASILGAEFPLLESSGQPLLQS